MDKWQHFALGAAEHDVWQGQQASRPADVKVSRKGPLVTA